MKTFFTGICFFRQFSGSVLAIVPFGRGRRLWASIPRCAGPASSSPPQSWSFGPPCGVSFAFLCRKVIRDLTSGTGARPLRPPPPPRRGRTARRIAPRLRPARAWKKNGGERKLHQDSCACIRFAMDRSFWQPVAQRLGGTLTVPNLRCRGHGASGTAGGAYNGSAFSPAISPIAPDPRRLGHRRFVAGGPCGCGIALAFDANYSGQAHLRRFGLIDTTGNGTGGPRAPAQWAESEASRAANCRGSALVEFQTTRWVRRHV